MTSFIATMIAPKSFTNGAPLLAHKNYLFYYKTIFY